MEKHDKTKVHLSARKKIALVALILVILVSLEVYAHTYVQVHNLSVVSGDEAIHSFPFGRSTGTYIFSSTGCKWLVVWKADEASASLNYGFICIYKVEPQRLFQSSDPLLRNPCSVLMQLAHCFQMYMC